MLRCLALCVRARVLCLAFTLRNVSQKKIYAWQHLRHDTNSAAPHSSGTQAALAERRQVAQAIFFTERLSESSAFALCLLQMSLRKESQKGIPERNPRKELTCLSLLSSSFRYMSTMSKLCLSERNPRKESQKGIDMPTSA